MENNNLASPLLHDDETNERVSSDKMHVLNSTEFNPRKAMNFSNKFTRILYAMFLFWRFFTLVIYVGRAINCCTKEAKASFQCTDGIFFPRDMEVEMVWILCSIFNMAICLRFTFLWHGVAGMKVIAQKLVKLPGFWSLIFLLLVSFSGLCIMAIKNNYSFPQIALIFLFVVQNIFVTTTVAVLNYTPVFHFMEFKNYQREVRILIKLTHVLLFIEFFSLFLVCTVQFGLQVTELDHSVKASESFRQVFGEMRRFGEVVYYYQIIQFFWTKLFVHNRDLLTSMHELLIHE